MIAFLLRKYYNCDYFQIILNENLTVTEGDCEVSSGVKSIFKLYLSKSIVTDGKTTRSKAESID